MTASPRPVVIIAEAGVNHNGDIQRALELVDAAADARADFVKFQTFRASRLVTADAAKAAYQIAATGAAESQRDMLTRLELSDTDHETLVARCAARGIGFLSTGFDEESIDLLVSLGVPYLKVPSGEITNLPYLRHIAAKQLPVLLSSGMATLGDIEAALGVLIAGGIAKDAITVLHCTSQYPAPLAEVNLRAMCTIRDAFQVNVGYSDHTLGIEVSLAATALGATVIEKHFTLDRTLPGPDHAASLEPDELTAMVSGIRAVTMALGDGIKTPTASEQQTRVAARRSIVAARPIRAGEILSAENVTAKRPASGVSPMRWDDVIGRVARRDFATDEMIEP
jgi:N-acetylneuraminate synthase